MDGARLWNASTASGISEREYAALFDTVSVCFSKGLGAPVGSVLAGTTEAIARARYYRKQQGGAMRQVGILAAAAQYALDFNHARLADDPKTANAEAAKLPGFKVDEAARTKVHRHRQTRRCRLGQALGWDERAPA